MYVFMRIYIHAYIPAYLHTCIPAYLHTYIPTYMHACIHTHIHTYMHTYIHTHTHKHTYIQGLFSGLTVCGALGLALAAYSLYDLYGRHKMVWGLREKREAEEDGPGGRANKAAVVEAWLASAVNKPAADLGEGLKLNGHDRSPQGRLVAFWVLNRWLEGIKGAYMLVCLVLFAYRYRHHVLMSCRIM
jgi:hypothetical protein